MRDSVEIIKDFLDLLSTVDKKYDALHEEVSKADKETSDLLHDLEFDRFDGCSGYKKAKRIKDIRIRRREAKNMMELLFPFRDYARNHIKEKFDLGKVIDQMNTTKREQSTRVYVPRICTDIKTANKHFKTDKTQAIDIIKKAM